MVRTLVLIGLILSFLTSISTRAQGVERHKIALSIYLADEIAFRSVNAGYLKVLFNKIYPDIEFRQIVVPTSVFGLNRVAIQEKIRKEILKTVGPQDEVQFLILDTHGNTITEKQQDVTSLALLGHFGNDFVDADFDHIFSYLRTKTSDDLTVVLNSCLTFCGPEKESQKRAAQFLKYFSAPNGKIYGAYVKEVDTVYVDPAASKSKYIRPSWKIFLTMTSLFGAAMSSGVLLSGDPTVGHFLTEFARGSLQLGLPLDFLAEVTIPIYSWWAGKKFANRGWLFSFRDGKLIDEKKVQKPHDFKLILGKVRCADILNSPNSFSKLSQ